MTSALASLASIMPPALLTRVSELLPCPIRPLPEIVLSAFREVFIGD